EHQLEPVWYFVDAVLDSHPSHLMILFRLSDAHHGNPHPSFSSLPANSPLGRSPPTAALGSTECDLNAAIWRRPVLRWQRTPRKVRDAARCQRQLSQSLRVPASASAGT